MQKASHRFRRTCAWITGLVLLCGGLVKIQDPVGSGLVMEEYFKFLHISFLNPIALAAGLALSLLECTLGLLLMTGLFRKVVAIMTMCMMAFFTAITVVLLIFKPEMNCGCFGSALEISHIESFIKNIILDILCLIAFVPLNTLGKTERKKKYVSAGITGTCVILLAVNSLFAIPVIDRTSYKPNKIIAAAEEIWEGEEEMVIEREPDLVFVYEKYGIRREFQIDEIPEDTTWRYVETRVEEDIESEDEVAPSIPLLDRHGNYRDKELAHDHVMLISVYSPEKIGEKKWNRIADFLDESEQMGFKTFLAICGNEDNIAGIPGTARERIKGFENVYFSDFKTLVTLNRSNAGVTFIHNGTIVRKWAYTYRPDTEDLEEIITSNDAENIMNSVDDKLRLEAFIAFIFAVLLLL